MTSCLFSAHQSPSKKGSALQGMNLRPKGVNSFLVEKTPFQKKRQNDFDRKEGRQVFSCLSYYPRAFRKQTRVL